MIYPPLAKKFVVPNLPLVNDRGESLSLHHFIQKGGDVTLFIPGFMSCHGVCPRLAQLYKQVLRDSGSEAQKVSVVFFSFDPNDTRSSLEMFRKHMELPDTWQVVHSTSQATQALLSSLQYTVMKAEGGYQHPAQAFMFTRDLAWVGSLYGTDVSSQELLTLLHQAEFQSEHPTLSATLEYLQNPNFIATAAGSGLVVGLFFVLWFAMRLRPMKNPKEVVHE